MDAKLRKLKREYETNPDDEQIKYRFRMECVRLGRAELAEPLEIGDVVYVSPTKGHHVGGIGTIGGLTEDLYEITLVWDGKAHVYQVVNKKGKWATCGRGRPFYDIITLVEPHAPY